MLNWIWACMLLASFLYSVFFSDAMLFSNALFSGAQDCVSFILKIGSFMVLWSGFIRIAEKASLTEKTAKLLSPLIRLVFKGIEKESRAEHCIAMNLTANLLGLSNAATPLGIAAMQELGKKSKNKAATNHMCMLAIINSASLQIVPSTLIAMRTAYGSSAPGDITVPIWLVSAMTAVSAVMLAKFFEGRDKVSL